MAASLRFTRHAPQAQDDQAPQPRHRAPGKQGRAPPKPTESAGCDAPPARLGTRVSRPLPKEVSPLEQLANAASWQAEAERVVRAKTGAKAQDPPTHPPQGSSDTPTPDVDSPPPGGVPTGVPASFAGQDASAPPVVISPPPPPAPGLGSRVSNQAIVLKVASQQQQQQQPQAQQQRRRHGSGTPRSPFGAPAAGTSPTRDHALAEPGPSAFEFPASSHNLGYMRGFHSTPVTQGPRSVN